MTLQSTPYLSFDGRAEQAMEFYQSALGGRLDIMRASQMPGDLPDGWQPDDLMHAALVVDDKTVVMASDGGDGEFGGVTVCLWGEDTAELQAAFDALSAGGNVQMPFGPSPWGSQFGQFTDRFDVPWMLEGGSAQ